MPVVTATLFSDGMEIDTFYDLISIDIRREVNKIPYANLVLLDGSASERKFELSNTKYFEPGRKVEIKLRYETETENKSLFKGPVICHTVEANNQGSLLRVEIKDASVILTQTRKSAVYEEQSDNEVISTLITNSGLEKGTINKTKPKYGQIVQYDCTDWDFIVSRAEAQGQLVITEDGKISVREVNLSSSLKHTFDYGISEIFDFECELDIGGQYPDVQCSAWDANNVKIIQQKETKKFALEQGNLDGSMLAKSVGFKTYNLSNPVPIQDDELGAWANGKLMRSRLSMIRGRLSTIGFADINLLDVIEIAGIGDRFNGKALVTGIRHGVDVNGWRTDIQFGLSARPFSREEAIQSSPAAGLVPGISGLQLGIIDKFDNDPDRQFRVKVIIPGIDEKIGSVWARLAAPDAGKDRGWFFRPETGDEVIVGFFNNDPRQAVILGSMYSPKNTPPQDYSEISEKNPTKALVSKTGSVISFNDDDKGSILITTAEGAQVLLNDGDKVLSLIDQNGNEINMDDNGITIKSAKDLKFEASGNVEIKGAKVDVK